MRIFLFCLLILGIGVYVRRTFRQFADREARAEFVRVSGRQIVALSIIVPVCFLLLKGCGALFFPSTELHYKLAVDVDVDGVEHHGEGVYRVGFQSHGPLLIGNEPPWTADVVGEAFPIDLGDRGLMFVSMVADRSDTPGRRFQSVAAGRAALESYFHLPVDGRLSLAKIKSFASSDTIENVPPTNLPLLLRFRDVDDPRTLERIDPLNPEASVGPGFKFVRATASITRENVTTGIEHYLKWLPAGRLDVGSSPSQSFDGKSYIDSDAFRQGYKR